MTQNTRIELAHRPGSNRKGRPDAFAAAVVEGGKREAFPIDAESYNTLLSSLFDERDWKYCLVEYEGRRYCFLGQHPKDRQWVVYGGEVCNA